MSAKKLTCREIAEHVCAELDEGMNSARCRAIRRHLETCPNCASYLNSLKTTVKLYRAYPAPALSARRRKALFEVIRHSGEETAESRKKSRSKCG